MNINMLMQQAKKMQNDMEKAKEEVSKKTFTAKQPLVEVEVNGDTEITKISISKDIEKEDIEVLEDMILIATNEAIRAFERRKEHLSIDNCAEAWNMLSDQYADSRDLEAVQLQKAIISLPRKQMLTFCLRYYDELSFEDIGLVTNSTPSGAKANYHQAKIKIIKQLKNE